MNRSCRFAAAALFLAAFIVPARAACTQGESEDKVRAAIYAMTDMHARNPAKAEVAKKKIDQALDEALKPAANNQAATDKLCKDMDEILAELRR